MEKYFCKCCLQCFRSEVLIKHRTDCLVINGKQSVRLKKGVISFKNCSRQLPAPFKIYADFERIFKKVDSIECDSDSSYTRKCQDHIPCSFAYKVVCVDNKLSKNVVLYRGKDSVYKFVKEILGEYNYCRRMARKYFNKNLIMSAEEERF